MLTLSTQKLFDIRLREDGKDRLAVGGIIDVGTGKEFVDDLLHLVVGEHLTIRCGDTLG